MTSFPLLTRFIEGIPHRAMQSDVYKNYQIPAGTVVMANIWYVTAKTSRLSICKKAHLEPCRHMMCDESLYPDPTKFVPERFAEENVTDPKDAVFGFGRR